jgi:hypothetical protein
MTKEQKKFFLERLESIRKVAFAEPASVEANKKATVARLTAAGVYKPLQYGKDGKPVIPVTTPVKKGQKMPAPQPKNTQTLPPDVLDALQQIAQIINQVVQPDQGPTLKEMKRGMKEAKYERAQRWGAAMDKVKDDQKKKAQADFLAAKKERENPTRKAWEI